MSTSSPISRSLAQAPRKEKISRIWCVCSETNFPSKHGMRGRKARPPQNACFHPLGTREGTGCRSAWAPDGKCGRSVHLSSAEEFIPTPTCKCSGNFQVYISKDTDWVFMFRDYMETIHDLQKRLSFTVIHTYKSDMCLETHHRLFQEAPFPPADLPLGSSLLKREN